MNGPAAKRPRLSISNIAWPATDDRKALDLAAKLRFDGVELAPGKVFGDLSQIPLGAVHAYRGEVGDRGLSVSALQSLLFGVQDVHLFESAASRERMASHLKRIAEIAGALGARACVFGSPTLRDPGTLSLDTACKIAEEFLHTIAPDYAAQGVELCFEANPRLYQCKFATHTEEAFNLVERVNAPGIALQLDTGTMFINGESPEVIRQVERRIGHFHVSEPNLAPIGTAGVDHTGIAAAVKSSAYSSWVSVEMKAVNDWCGAMERAYNLVRSTYVEQQTDL
jgi:sugar phosphate isomerase/epimerase